MHSSDISAFWRWNEKENCGEPWSHIPWRKTAHKYEIILKANTHKKTARIKWKELFVQAIVMCAYQNVFFVYLISETVVFLPILILNACSIIIARC